MKDIDFQRLASRMRTLQTRFPLVCRKTFVFELKGIFNTPEAERFFQYFCETQKLIPAKRKFHFMWTVKQEFFEPDMMRKIVIDNLISSSQFRSYQVKKSWKTRKEPVEIAEVNGAKMAETTIKALSAFSDEELRNELNRRAELHKQKERLSTILSVAEISLNELKSLIQLVG